MLFLNCVEVVDSMVLPNVILCIRWKFEGSGFYTVVLTGIYHGSCCCDGSRRDSLSTYASWEFLWTKKMKRNYIIHIDEIKWMSRGSYYGHLGWLRILLSVLSIETLMMRTYLTRSVVCVVKRRKQRQAERSHQKKLCLMTQTKQLSTWLIHLQSIV